MSNTQIVDSLLRTDLSSFFHKSFYTLSPGTKFCHNWHIDLLADSLYDLIYKKGGTKRLIVNIPPRYLKSTCISVSFPSWLIGRDPRKKVIVASYSQKLSIKHSLDSRLIIQSDWYKNAFPDVKLFIGQNEKYKFQTTYNGFRLATSVGGTLTGEGGDVLILDDPLSPLQASSKVYRDNIINWFEQTFVNRLNNKKEGVIIIVMSRLHQNDLVGYILSKYGEAWTHIDLPAVAKNDQSFSFCNNVYMRKEGEFLQAAREGQKEIELAKVELGSYGFAAQYQQDPLICENNMLKRSWLNFYDTTIDYKDNFVLQSWDTANSNNESSDFSVCTTWVIYNNNFYLIDVFRDKLIYDDLVKEVQKLSRRWDADSILIENKASGQQLIQHFSVNSMLSIIPVIPKYDKITRFYAILPIIEAGRLYLPTHKGWLGALEDEILSFPQVKHDDQVDSLVQALEWVTKNNACKIELL